VYEGSDDIYSPHKAREKERRGMTTMMMTTTTKKTNTYNKLYKKKKSGGESLPGYDEMLIWEGGADQ